MAWVVTTKVALALRVIAAIERRFPDAEDCVDAGEGVHETRTEYRVKYRPARVFYKLHPDGTRIAIWMNAAAKTIFTAIRSAIQQKRAAGKLDADDAEIDALPADVPALDASWDAAPPPPQFA